MAIWLVLRYDSFVLFVVDLDLSGLRDLTGLVANLFLNAYFLSAKIVNY